uniref:CCR4-NOT transcription complex subunit 10 n=1 Tax=Phaeomonas parva TaxID=124430 RepID=A0A7S1U3K9_9STRA
MPCAAKALQALERELDLDYDPSRPTSPKVAPGTDGADPLLSVARGTVHFSRGEFVKAQMWYAKALEGERKQQEADVNLGGLNPALGLQEGGSQHLGMGGWRAAGVTPGLAGVGFDADLVIAAANNMAIAALYTCQLNRAVQILEDLIRQDPHRYLCKETAFNLCTLYDLSCEPSVAGRKKRVLQQVALLFYLEDLNAQSFRIPG